MRANLGTEQPDDFLLETSPTILEGGHPLDVILLEGADIGTTIENTDATAFPSNYMVCQRTGYRLKIKHGLIRDGETRSLVRHISRDEYHQQNRVKSKAEELPGSPRPEHRDGFVTQISAYIDDQSGTPISVESDDDQFESESTVGGVTAASL